MILAFCFCTRDQDLALKNLQWWNELGGCKGHNAVVGYDPRCDPATVETIRQEFVKAFDKVIKLNVTSEVDGWPEGANLFMRLSAAYLQDRKDCRYFFWMEPDAIPLRSGWLDAIEAEYKAAGKPFMGDRVEVADIPLHMSGIGVYWNPLHQKAGEAYRAHDIAFDMAAKDQIVPQAHFTKLINHAWKHPKFTSIDELRTQMRPEALIFHSSKDGSLIDLLRAQKNFPAVPVLAEPIPNESAQGGEARESIKPTVSGLTNSSKLDFRGGGETIYDIFIRTYAPDYDWLRYCVEAIDKFASGFRKVWIVSPHNPPVWMQERGRGMFSTIPIDWRIMNEEAPDGYLSQQIHKLYADAITGYEADYYLHIDSDVVLTQAITPQSFLDGNHKVIWPFTPYSAIETPWQPITAAFLGRPVEYEFMRRFPIMVPKWLYGKLREYAHATHGRIISEYIRTRPHREFSEFNALGAYAYEFHRDKFAWRNTLEAEGNPTPFGKQYHSWSGLTAEIKNEIETLLREGQTESHQPHKLETVGSTPTPATIKKLPNDIWVLEGDQISGWVEQEGRLDHDQNFLPEILKHIKPGDTVIDAGAFIGDHTIAYAQAVGTAGMVYAFEPNPLAFQCLEHNIAGFPNVQIFNYGLSDKRDMVPLSGNNNNFGGAYVGEHMKISNVKMFPLDDELPLGADLIKIDVEGYEPRVLQGAENLINKYRPKMVIEINPGALGRQGYTPIDIFEWLNKHDYIVQIIQQHCDWDDPMYDVLCLPIPKPEPKPVSVPTPVAGISTPEEMREYVDRLKAFSESSSRNKQLLMQRLVHVGLKKPNPLKHKHRHDKIPAIFKKKK